MKKLFYIIPILGALLTIACEDMLDQKAPDQLTTDSFWRNKADVEAGMASAYAMLENAIGSYDFAEIKWPVEAFREDLYLLGKDASQYENWTSLFNFTYTNGNPQLKSYWTYNYIGISRANQVISNLSDPKKIPSSALSDKDREQLLAEAYFLRGYYHLKLLLNWEKIIIRDKYITSQNEIDKTLASREEAWDFIVSDLIKGTKLVQTRDEATLGRATQGAAYSYLGFAYLTMGWEQPAKKNEYFDKSVKAFDNVKGYTLVSDYLSMFDGTSRNTSESIFELQFTNTTANGANYRPYLHKWMSVDELGGWDEILPNKRLVDEYKKEGEIATTGRYDSRLFWNIFLQDPYFNDQTNPRVYGSTYDKIFGKDKPAFRKYLPKTLEDLKKQRVPINVPLMRLANVLLMKAEALNELERPQDAIPLINQVRARADMPALPLNLTKTEVRTKIEHERIVELPLENFRFYDLRRWGKTKEALHAIGRTNFDPTKHNFYPIPLTELNSNGAL